MRSARRWTGALPVWASSTSRAIWASAVSAPTFVARTIRRPPALTVAPAISEPGRDLDRDRLAGEHAHVDGAGALLDDAVGGDLLARADDEAVADGELLDGDAALGAVGVEDRDVLGAELEQRLQRGAGAALGLGLEVAPGEQEGGDDARRLEVDLVGALARVGDDVEGHAHVVHAGVADEQRVQRPQPRGQRADADQRVHRGRAVLEVGPRGLVERPRAPTARPA